MAATLRWPHLMAELRNLVKSFGGEHLDTCVKQNKQNFLNLLNRYVANTADFSQYLHFDESGYTKNLVEEYEGNKGNVIIMCWSPSQQSAFHSHEGSRCFVKVLAGQLLEQQVDMARRVTTTSLLRENQVTYIDDSIGLHKVINQSSDTPAVTLHVYLPAYTRCRIFEGSRAGDLSMDKSHAIDVEFRSRSAGVI